MSRVAWSILAFLASSSLLALRPSPLADDGYVYLNVADNLAHHRGPATSLIHFDTERSHGIVPAPLTTFPPGYPSVISLASVITQNMETAARSVSLLSFTGSAALLAWALIVNGVGAWLRIVLMLLFVGNAVTLDFSTAVLTESLYTFASAAAVFTLMWAERDEGSGSRATAVVLAYVTAGLAYWVRYAGLFLAVALLSYGLILAVHRRGRSRFAYLGGCLALCLIIGAGMLRNQIVVGTWKGGNTLVMHNPIPGLLADFGRAQWHLILGDGSIPFSFWLVLFLVGASTLAVLASLSLRRFSFTYWPKFEPGVWLAVCVVALYTAGLLYSGRVTPITFGTRMFVPMLPFYLLLLGIASKSLASRPLVKQAAAVLAIGYLGVNAQDLRKAAHAPRYRVLAAEYSERTAAGEPLGNWVSAHIGPNETIAADDGQATGYLLRRPVLSLIGPQYSRQRWDCDDLRNEMRRFGAHYLILYRPTSTNRDALLTGSQFIAEAATQPPSCGFSIGAETADVRILEMNQ